MAFKKIAGWHVNLASYKKVATLEELKRDKQLFYDLPAKEKDAAFLELWNILKPPAKGKDIRVD
jgi:hypothetical protein